MASQESTSNETPTGRERREHERYYVGRLVQGRAVLRRRVHVSNLSLSGVALESPSRLDPGRSHTVTLLNSTGHEIHLGGRVVWCHLVGTRLSDHGEDQPVFRAGLEFENVLHGDTRKLHLLLEDRGDRTFEQRVFGRFELTGNRETDLETVYDFSIDSVSKGGMCIQTECNPPQGTLLPLKISLPGRIVDLEGRVAYVTPPSRMRDRSGIRQIGMAYTQLPLEGFDPLEDLLDDGSVSLDPVDSQSDPYSTGSIPVTRLPHSPEPIS